MALQSGRYATVRIGAADIVPFLGHWEINVTQDSADATYFGSVWGDSIPTFQGWTGTIDGFFDNSTNSTQLVLLSSGVMKAALINNLRFYVDTSSGKYFMPNYITTDSTDAGAYVNSYRVTADKAGITSISMGVIGYGPIALFDGGSSGGLTTIIASSS